MTTEMGNNGKNEKNGTWITVCLTLGFVLVTAALVVMTVLGGIYLRTLQNSNENRNPLNLQQRASTADTVVLGDRQQEVKLVKNKDQNGALVSLVEVDYKRSIISMHLTKENLCFLLGGVVPEVGSFDKSVRLTVALAAAEQAITKSNTPLLAYRRNQVNPPKIAEIEFFTKALTPYCTNKNTYWLDRIPQPQPQQTTTSTVTNGTSTNEARSRKKRCFILCLDVHFSIFG